MESNYRNTIAVVKAAYDIADYMRAAGLNLKPNGIGKWKVSCPFHRESTPSCVINDSFQNYRCFGCGANGDIITFVTEYENLNFTDALKKLAEDKNIIIDLKESNDGVDYDSLRKILKLAANFYCKQFDALPESHVAKTEITDRGLTYNNRKADWLRYGYSPSGNHLSKYLKSEGFSDELLVQSGLCHKNSETGDLYDFFRSRLMFIFTDRYGKPVGFSSRKLFEDDKRGKYVNSSESALFHKSQVLYNHSLARKNSGKEKELFVCEGQFDVAAFVEAGMSNVVASSGTAFTKDQVVECKKLVGSDGKLVFCFDGDKAGIDAATKVFLSFPSIHEDAYVVIFPDGKDPCDYRLSEGSEGLKEYVSNPLTLVEFMIVNAKTRFDLSSVVGRTKYVNEAAKYVKTVSNMTLRDNCIRLLSLESLTSIEVVKAAVEKAEPLTFDSYDNENNEIQDEVVEEHTERFETLKELIYTDDYYKVSAYFTSLGLMRKAWRASVVRSQSLLPKSFHPFIEELKSREELESIFPELFSDYELAELLMNNDFSDLYKFMSIEELKDHFIYLHKRLDDMVKERRESRVDERLLELLVNDETASLDYFRKLVERKKELSI